MVFFCIGRLIEVRSVAAHSPIKQTAFNSKNSCGGVGFSSQESQSTTQTNKQLRDKN